MLGIFYKKKTKESEILFGLSHNTFVCHSYEMLGRRKYLMENLAKYLDQNKASPLFGKYPDSSWVFFFIREGLRPMGPI